MIGTFFEESFLFNTYGLSSYLQFPLSEIFGGLLLRSPSVHDFDQREMFCFYLFPGNQQSRKVSVSLFCNSVRFLFFFWISYSVRFSHA